MVEGDSFGTFFFWCALGFFGSVAQGFFLAHFEGFSVCLLNGAGFGML